VFGPILESSNFIEMIFNESYVNDQNLIKGGEDDHFYLQNLFKFIEKFSLNVNICKIMIPSVCSTLQRHECCIVKHVSRHLTKMIGTNYFLFMDGKIFDAIIETDSALKYYLINNEYVNEIAEARGETVGFVLKFIVTDTHEYAVFTNEFFTCSLYSMRIVS
jgi:hypothetical protein